MGPTIYRIPDVHTPAEAPLEALRVLLAPAQAEPAATGTRRTRRALAWLRRR